mgnify:CR=1 FL=1
MTATTNNPIRFDLDDLLGAAAWVRDNVPEADGCERKGSKFLRFVATERSRDALGVADGIYIKSAPTLRGYTLRTA